MAGRIYADHNATTPLCQEAKDNILKSFEFWGNPSSSHQLGRQATQLLLDSRQAVARLAEVNPNEIVFTSGGSEANTLALLGSRYETPDFRLLTTSVEHSSVRGTCELIERTGGTVERLPVNSDGQLDFAHFQSRLKEFKPHLVSVMTANNETGVLFPIADILKACRESGSKLHTDAVQVLGKVAPSYWNQADLISISAHKINGPKGTGALIIRNGNKLVAIQSGGTQEVKRRGGTENLPGIMGFAGACEHSKEVFPLWETVAKFRDSFEDRLCNELEDIAINGKPEPRLPHTSNIRFCGISSEVMLGALDMDGICVSAGSACSSGSISPSPVLLAMGLGEEGASESVRISWGTDSGEDEFNFVADRIIFHVKRIRQRRGRST